MKWFENLFLCIFLCLVGSSELEIPIAKGSLGKMTFSKDNFVSSYYRIRHIYLTLNENNPYNARHQFNETLLSVVKNYFRAIGDYYTLSTEECLQMVLDSNDIQFYVFFGLLLSNENLCFVCNIAFDYFELAKEDPRKYKSICGETVYSYGDIIKYGILFQPLSQDKWQARMGSILTVIEIMEKSSIKLRCRRYFAFDEYVDRLKFVMENFEVEGDTNQPSIQAFIKLYYDLEYIVTRNGPQYRKIEKKLISLFKVYLKHISFKENYLEQYSSSLPIKLLCMVVPSYSKIGLRLRERIRMSIEDNIKMAIKAIKLWALGCDCPVCNDISKISQKSTKQLEQCRLTTFKTQNGRNRILRNFLIEINKSFA